MIEFLGVPYAAPPVGSLRWARPQPVAPWTGTRDATKPFTPCAQAQGEVARAVSNEDCLYLNITAPLHATNRPAKPVMVWLHGGGLLSGTANTYDPRRLAAEGDVVVVTVESRLNIFGYLALPGLEGSGTFGLEDEQAALRWIRRNIGAFGGDPDDVTLFGQSGGAVRACAHLVSPASAGLFDQVILQSGTCSTSWPAGVLEPEAGSFFRDLEAARAAGTQVAEALGCLESSSADTLACLRELPAAQLLEQGNVFAAAAHGTPVLPLAPADAVALGRFHPVPVMTGFTRDEARALVASEFLFGPPPDPASYQQKLEHAFGERTPAVEARYPLAEYPSAALRWAAVVTDRMFVCPQLRDASAFARSTPTFVYEFADPNGVGLLPFPPDLPPGASHSSELPLLFDLTNGAPLDITTGMTIPLREAQQTLGLAMIRYWTQFARTQDPNSDRSPAWSRAGVPAGRRALQLAPGTDGIQPVDSDELHHCDLWQGLIDGAGP